MFVSKMLELEDNVPIDVESTNPPGGREDEATSISNVDTMSKIENRRKTMNAQSRVWDHFTKSQEDGL